jgi:Domain of unknown function (DUF5071)
MRDDFQTRNVRRELRKLLPSNKDDLGAVDSLIARGYPSIEPILPDVLKWIRQPDWPVAGPLSKFLLSLGPSLLPHIHKIFSSPRDEAWKAEILRTIVQYWPKEHVAEVKSYLTMLATHGQSWGVDLISLRLLARHQLVDRDWIAGWLDFKSEFHREQLQEIESIRQLNSNSAA